MTTFRPPEGTAELIWVSFMILTKQWFSLLPWPLDFFGGYVRGQEYILPADEVTQCWCKSCWLKYQRGGGAEEMGDTEEDEHCFGLWKLTFLDKAREMPDTAKNKEAHSCLFTCWTSSSRPCERTRCPSPCWQMEGLFPEFNEGRLLEA